MDTTSYWLNTDIPFKEKEEQNLFWQMYEASRRLASKDTPKLNDTLRSMRAYARKRGWNRGEWLEFVGRKWCSEPLKKREPCSVLLVAGPFGLGERS